MELPYDPAIAPLIRKDMQPNADYIFIYNIWLFWPYFGIWKQP